MHYKDSTLLILARIVGVAAVMPLSGDAIRQATVDRYAGMLTSDNAMTRAKGAIALGRIGEPAFPALIAALSNPSLLTRIEAANALRNMGRQGSEGVEALAANLSAGDEPITEIPSTYTGSPALQLRWAVLSALGRMEEKALPAVPALIEALRGTHESALAQADPSNRSWHLHWRGYEVRGGAAWVLQRIGLKAAKEYPQVISALGTALVDPSCMVRLNAVMALRAMGHHASRALPQLLEALKHQDQLTRIYAAFAFSVLSEEAKPYASAIIDCHDSIHLDNISRNGIRQVIEAAGVMGYDLANELVTTAQEYRWNAIDRLDFQLVIQPYAESSLAFEPNALVESFVNARMGNALGQFVDHHWYNVAPPTAEQLAYLGMGMVWYFFTEDIFNPKLQRDWAFATVEDYNLAMVKHILHCGKVLGKDKVIWAVGHEHMDAARMWGNREDGEYVAPDFRTRKGGYEFYRRWITTSTHKLHWIVYGSTRPGKFFDGWNVDSGATWEFIAKHNLDVSCVTMASGGVSPVLGHATFDILPQAEVYWWETQIDGASQQVGVAYLRGASRQYGREWLLDASPWSPIHGGPGRGFIDGAWTGGVTDSQQLRSWVYGYLSGARAVFEESCAGSHFMPTTDSEGLCREPILTTSGETAQKAARFCFQLCQERGESFAPVGVLLEHEHGFEPRPHTNFRGKGAWYYMPFTPSEEEIEAFWYAAFPEHSTQTQQAGGEYTDPMAVEPLLLTESTFGDCFDVLTDRAPRSVLARYPRLIVLGGIRLRGYLLSRLTAYVEAGGALLLNEGHVPTEDPVVRTMYERFLNLPSTDVGGEGRIFRRQYGRGEVILVKNRSYLGEPDGGKAASWLPAVTEFLHEWIRPVWPVEVRTRNGHQRPQCMLNRLRDGWLITVGNHWGEVWQGKVELHTKSNAEMRVDDVWNQTQIEARCGKECICFEASVRPYTLGVFRVTILPG